MFYLQTVVIIPLDYVMIWLNPVPNLGWYCDTTPVPAVIFFSQGVYVVATPNEQQNATSLEQAEQIGHDMVLSESKLTLSLSFRSFFIDLPTDAQHIYIIDSSNVITTGVFSLGASTVTDANANAFPIAGLTGWAAMGN